MDLELRNKVAVVTGASRGIGKGIATSLGAEGCRLVICARRRDDLDEAAAELAAVGAEVRPVVLDITQEDAGAMLSQAAVEAFGSIDIFVGNAGTNRRKPFADTTEDDWTAVLEVNLRAHVRCSRAMIPAMKEAGGGSIVFISSIFGREAGGPGLSLYNVTKSALISLSKIMAQELGKDGIRVNSIAPGSVRFPGGSWDRRCNEDPAGMAEFIAENLPLGRFGTVREIADVVAFVCSPRAGWISGACINVDGVQSKSLI